MKNRIRVIALLFVLCFCVANVRAELITITLSATVDYVDGGSLFGITAGSTVTGSYTYESTTSDTNPFTTVGDYWHYATPAGISLTVGGFQFKTDPTNVNFLVSIGNDYPPDDNYLVRSYNNLPLSNDASIGIIDWWLRDNTGTALTSTALPVIEPILNQWQINQLDMYCDNSLIRSHVTNVTLVPEPATMFLLGLGGILFIKRK